MTDEMRGLIERIEALTKSDSSVNDDIARFLGWTQHSDENDPVYTRRPQLWWAEPREEWSTMTVVPNYTGSIDAAMTLVPEGAFPKIERLATAWLASVRSHHWADERSVEFDAYAATPALALCAAALKALSTIEGHGDG